MCEFKDTVTYYRLHEHSVVNPFGSVRQQSCHWQQDDWWDLGKEWKSLLGLEYLISRGCCSIMWRIAKFVPQRTDKVNLWKGFGQHNSCSRPLARKLLAARQNTLFLRIYVSFSVSQHEKRHRRSLSPSLICSSFAHTTNIEIMGCQMIEPINTYY